MPTILHRLNRWVQEAPKAAAQGYKDGGNWKSITSQEMRDRIYYLALFLESRGINPQEIGCILSGNCPEWVHIDLAIMLTGAKAAGLYPNSTSKDILYVLNHTEATVLAVRNAEFFHKIVDENGKPALPDRIRLLLVIDGDTSVHPKAVSYAQALAEGKKIAQSGKAPSFEQHLAKIDPVAGAFLIYTSGTTGNPKGALLSHDNLVYTSDLAANTWKLPFARGTLFSFLPLCHIAEKLHNEGVGISQRYEVKFATKFDNVGIELPEAQPTLLLCVPRVWEKFMEGVLAKVESSPAPRRKLAKWALDVGARVAAARYGGTWPSVSDLIQHRIAEKLVLSKIRKAMGLGRAELMASGAAALPAHVSRWFRCLNLEILEDFGQTESTGVICMTESGVEMAGTVGRAVQGVEVKIASDGEVLCRGRNVFVGYFKNPEATAEVLKDGWLHTGDLGEVTEKGLIRIRGRKKEILKTSGGKMIAPLPIEEKLKASPFIGQVCLVGDNRKFISAIITPSESALKDFKQKGAEINAAIKQAVDEINQGLASYEQIKKFTVIPREFSIVDGEMTPTLKMKRNVIEKRFKDLIDKMYA